MNGLQGKVAVVTGGAKGIGQASVRAFLAAGAEVAIGDLDEAAGAALAEELGRAARFRRLDVTDDGDIAAFVAWAETAFGGIDILVNCAVYWPDDGLGSARETWLASFDTNVVSPAKMLAAVAPSMKARGGGAAVNFSSIAGKFGQKGRGCYPVAKAAVQQLTRNQAMEYAADGIRVNAVSPGWTWAGPIVELARGEIARGDRLAAEYFPLARLGRAEDVAAGVLYLCSEAAAFVTGIDLPVDGGYAMIGPDRGLPQMGRMSEA